MEKGPADQRAFGAVDVMGVVSLVGPRCGAGGWGAAGALQHPKRQQKMEMPPLFWHFGHLRASG